MGRILCSKKSMPLESAAVAVAGQSASAVGKSKPTATGQAQKILCNSFTLRMPANMASDKPKSNWFLSYRTVERTDAITTKFLHLPTHHAPSHVTKEDEHSLTANRTLRLRKPLRSLHRFTHSLLVQSASVEYHSAAMRIGSLELESNLFL